MRLTGLNVKEAHTIVNCEKKNLDAAIFQHAQAVKAQFTYLRLIIDKAETLGQELAETPEKTTKRNGKNTGGATAHIPGVTVPAAAPVTAQA